eukprot:ctg_1157.g279
MMYTRQRDAPEVPTFDGALILGVATGDGPAAESAAGGSRHRRALVGVGCGGHGVRLDRIPRSLRGQSAGAHGQHGLCGLARRRAGLSAPETHGRPGTDQSGGGRGTQYALVAARRGRLQRCARERGGEHRPCGRRGERAASHPRVGAGRAQHQSARAGQPLAAIQTPRRGGGAAGVPGRHHHAAGGCIRPRRPLPHPHRRHAATLAVLPAHQARRRARTTGVGGRRGARHHRLGARPGAHRRPHLRTRRPVHPDAPPSGRVRHRCHQTREPLGVRADSGSATGRQGVRPASALCEPVTAIHPVRCAARGRRCGDASAGRADRHTRAGGARVCAPGRAPVRTDHSAAIGGAVDRRHVCVIAAAGVTGRRASVAGGWHGCGRRSGHGGGVGGDRAVFHRHRRRRVGALPGRCDRESGGARRGGAGAAADPGATASRGREHAGTDQPVCGDGARSAGRL